MPTISTEYSARARIVLATRDAATFLRAIPNETISLILTSPPYNVGKEYEPKLSQTEYVASQLAAIAELVRVLRQDGSICWQVGSYMAGGEVLPLDILYYPLFKSFNMILRNRVVWHYRHGLHSKRRFSGRYETILWFTKSDTFTFNLDAVRVPARYPGKRNYKGPRKGEPSGNPNGTNPSDFWDSFPAEWEEAVWDFPNVKSNHPEKTAHPC